jgi:hypothetical protein
MLKKALFLDFETYYHQQLFTLRKLTIPEYILDDRFEVIMCSVAINGGDPFIVEGPDMGAFLAQHDPAECATVTFNSLFDNSILSWCYGWTPRLILDSMSMARALRGHVLKRLNLETVVAGVLGRTRNKTTILKASGKTRADMKADPAFWTEFCAYCNQDNIDQREIFLRLLPGFRPNQQDIMDLVIRAAVQPRFMVDRPLLEDHLANIRAEKVRLLNACGLKLSPGRQLSLALKAASAPLLSAVKFQEQLEALGVEIKTKPSPTGVGTIPAFAKTDAFMEELQNHFDPRVQALACARLGIKSTIEETRTERLIAISKLSWARYRDGNPRFYSGGEMPIPLRFAGGHTHRLSGDWKLNMQNLPAGRAGKTKTIRKALVAPPGFAVVAGDLSQIEARLTAWLAKCGRLLAAFADPSRCAYCEFGTRLFGFTVTRGHGVHRFISKTGVLGLEYQCGALKFYNMVLTLARLGGIDLQAAGIDWTVQWAEQIVSDYRKEYREIPSLWYLLQTAVERFLSKPGDHFMNVGPVTIRYGEIEGPNGLKMKYHNPRYRGGEYVFDYGFGTYKMYGGKMLENIIQFLAYIHAMNTALRMWKKYGMRLVLQAHDELAYIVPLKHVDLAKNLLYKELTRRPSWAPDLPLEAEVKSGPSYGECK